MTSRRSVLSSGLTVAAALAGVSRLPLVSKAAAATAEPQTVAVLGATGRTGTHIVSHLTSAGHRVRGVSRSADRQDPRDGVDWISADVRQPETLASAFEGADSIIYAVGVDFQKVDAQTLYDVYHLGVETSAREAKRAGLKRMILLSSAGRVRPSELPEEYRASMDSKAKGEAALKAAGIEYAISRTPGLWNRPGGEYGILLLQNELLPPGGPFMICREDSAAVLAACAVTGDAANKTFTVMNAITYEVDSWRGALAELSAD